ncbi:unnamed protein product [Rotaria sordida]|uniref:Uncharacterized protein n=1 Tax=Rotaria sordida TaxID=392033 RepID=A0A815MIC5_9BILA|nr:unnamed protein product [Rotaria sordida]CAF1424877.1 unnamed protein product [Rotaria sordida]CAF3677449.1 unnamed protein product [Rotaria sordida]
MGSNSYLLSIVALCFILMQICSSIIVTEQYLPSIKIDNKDVDDQVYVRQRLAHLLFPSTSFSNQLNERYDDQDFQPMKRESFGRKQHWDVFFGRR